MTSDQTATETEEVSLGAGGIVLGLKKRGGSRQRKCITRPTSAAGTQDMNRG